MGLTSVAQTTVLLSAAAGAVHACAPDHWLPASVVAWQRGWSRTRGTLFSTAAMTYHVLLGLLAYFCFDRILLRVGEDRIFTLALGIVAVFTFVRFVRFQRVREVYRAGPASVWGMVAVFSLLGPCETIVPILLKARSLGIGYFIPFLGFLAGSIVASVSLVWIGQSLWDRPLWLPRSMAWARQGSSLVPIAAVLALGIGAILRI